MSKTIRVIDLLNKIANGEDVPKKVLIDDEVYYLIKDEDGNIVYSRRKDSKDWESFIDEKIAISRSLNDKVLIIDDEIIEEQEDIDIQKLNENIKYYNIIGLSENEKMLFNMIQDTANRINKLVQAVKQLNKKIKEKKTIQEIMELNNFKKGDE